MDNALATCRVSRVTTACRSIPPRRRKSRSCSGPATLLYGANAIGGLVNVITDEIPTKPMMGMSGNLTFDLGTAASEGGAAGDVHVGNGTLALHVGGGGRRSATSTTPEGDVVNSQSRNGFGNVGLSWTGDEMYVGGSYGYDDTKYGIPVVEDGAVQLTPRRHALTFRGGANALGGPFESFRATLAIRRYEHEELEGDEVATSSPTIRPISSCWDRIERSAAYGQRRWLAARSQLRRPRRRGALTGGGSARVRSVPVRRS